MIEVKNKYFSQDVRRICAIIFEEISCLIFAITISYLILLLLNESNVFTIISQVTNPFFLDLGVLAFVFALYVNTMYMANIICDLLKVDMLANDIFKVTND